MHRHAIPLGTLVLCLAAATLLASPKVGDKAPEVKVAKWFNDKPPSLPGDKDSGKHVFVVEFWATWCGPCRRSIPHLAELHKKHAKDGLVIIGVSNEEADEIQAFLKKGPAMPYHVAMDDDMATNEAWADDIKGIPHAYIVDKSSTVVWSGNPLDFAAFDETLKEVMAGTFDLEAAKNAAANQSKYDELMKELQQTFVLLKNQETQADEDEASAARTEGEKKVFEILEKLISLRPKDLRAYLIKRQLLRDFDRKKDAIDFDIELCNVFKESAASLSQLADIELGAPLPRRNPEFMLRCARRANELNEGRHAATLATLARIECEFGMIDEAIRHQTEAVGLSTREEEKANKEVLSYFKSIKALHKTEVKTAGSRSGVIKERGGD